MIGTILSHYKIEHTIGQGGMGVVYRAIDTRLGRVVAIKVIAADAAGDRDRRDRFLKEARSITRTSSRFTKWTTQLQDVIREILDWLDRYLGPVTPG